MREQKRYLVLNKRWYFRIFILISYVFPCPSPLTFLTEFLLFYLFPLEVFCCCCSHVKINLGNFFTLITVHLAIFLIFFLLWCCNISAELFSFIAFLLRNLLESADLGYLAFSNFLSNFTASVFCVCWL